MNDNQETPRSYQFRNRDASKQKSARVVLLVEPSIKEYLCSLTNMSEFIRTLIVAEMEKDKVYEEGLKNGEGGPECG